MEEYTRARRAALKEYHRALQEGRYPYPPALADVLPEGFHINAVPAGLFPLPLEDIAGTAEKARQQTFSGHFLPLAEERSEFAMKWSALYLSQCEEGIREPVKVYEYLKRFYVQEGNKRVSVLRFIGADMIDAEVKRIRPSDETLAAFPAYAAFCDFFAVAHTYEITCERDGAYAALAKACGETLSAPWDEAHRRLLLHAHRRFKQAYLKKGGDASRIPAGDALCVYAEVYGLEDMTTIGEKTLSVRIGKLWEEILLLEAPGITYVETPPETQTEHRILLPSLFRRESAYSAAHPLRVAFVHARSVTSSAWVYGHELGRTALEEQFPDIVQTEVYTDCMEEADVRAAVDRAVSHGAEVVFTTSPAHMPATLKCAIHYPLVSFFNCSVNLSHHAVRTYETRLYEAKFLMGALAASYADNHCITYIADLPVYGSLANINAFAAGAAMVDPKSVVYLFWSCVQGFDLSRIVSASGADVFSGPDLQRAEYYSREFGVYLSRRDGTIDNLAMPLRDWGAYYKLLLTYFLDGTRRKEIQVFDKQAVNYWWGLTSGVVDVLPSRALSPASLALIEALKNALIADRTLPFHAPSPEAKDNLAIIEMSTLADNVHGTLPDPDRLTEEARRITDIAGLDPYRQEAP